MPRQVALLRGVNVGRARRIAMADLRGAVAGLGYGDVATLLQSGNVVFTTSDAASTARRRVAAAVAEAAGFDVDVVVRTAAQVARVVDGNPLADVATDPKRLQVIFLGSAPAATALAGLEEAAVGDDVIRVRGRELYVWSPGGVIRSPALDEIERRRLGVVATARNWSTVLKLRAMLSA